MPDCIRALSAPFRPYPLDSFTPGIVSRSMTLITYLSRIHFADGVLEVALSSELELNNFKRPLLVSEPHAVSAEFSDRVNAGLPFWCQSSSHQIKPKDSMQLAIESLTRKVNNAAVDVVVAFGSSLALCVADACCRDSSSMAEKATTGLDFFAIPGVDGIPTMSMPRKGSVRTRPIGTGIQPSAVVIDPTLIVGESAERTASAVANTMARCLSAHFSNAYNPPADGIAVEGFKRIVRNLNKIAVEDSLEMRRELMAASLSATLAMQKDLGIANEICEIIVRTTERPVNEGALMRLLIVVEAQLMETHWTQERLDEVRATLGVPDDLSIQDWLSTLLNGLALPGTLAELGISGSVISQASRELATNRSALVGSAAGLCEMLNGVELGRVADVGCVR